MWGGDDNTTFGCINLTTIIALQLWRCARMKIHTREKAEREEMCYGDTDTCKCNTATWKTIPSEMHQGGGERERQRQRRRQRQRERERERGSERENKKNKTKVNKRKDFIDVYCLLEETKTRNKGCAKNISP